MKVAQISPTFFGDASVVGGGERYARELARELAKHATTSLITFSRHGKHPAVERDGDLEIRRYPASRFVGGNLANPFTFGFLKDLRSFDVLHCYGYPKVVTDLCILFAKLYRKKLFITDVHGGGTCASTYLSKVGVDTRRFVDGFLLLSAFNAQRYEAHRARVRVIGGGVDAGYFGGSKCARERRVLFVGRLIPVKGVNYLIQAVDPDTPVRIIGRPYDQGYFQQLQTLAHGKKVEFLTDIGDADLVREYSSAQLTVVPSVYNDLDGRQTSGELFGLVALEAMACGTPVVATQCGGLPEVVEDGVTGFVVPPNNAAALGEKIRLLLEQPETARAMGEAGRERVLREFTWDRVAANCLTAYEEALRS